MLCIADTALPISWPSVIGHRVHKVSPFTASTATISQESIGGKPQQQTIQAALRPLPWRAERCNAKLDPPTLTWLRNPNFVGAFPAVIVETVLASSPPSYMYPYSPSSLKSVMRASAGRQLLLDDSWLLNNQQLCFCSMASRVPSTMYHLLQTVKKVFEAEADNVDQLERAHRNAQLNEFQRTAKVRALMFWQIE
jgi:hypothetical protein